LYYIYILECEDESLYTGITSDLKKRMRAHFYKLPSAAKYTKSHNVKEIKALYKTNEKSNALKLEAYIKTFKADKKRLICSSPSLIFNDKFKESDFEIVLGVTLESCLN